MATELLKDLGAGAAFIIVFGGSGFGVVWLWHHGIHWPGFISFGICGLGIIGALGHSLRRGP